MQPNRQDRPSPWDRIGGISSSRFTRTPRPVASVLSMGRGPTETTDHVSNEMRTTGCTNVKSDKFANVLAETRYSLPRPSCYSYVTNVATRLQGKGASSGIDTVQKKCEVRSQGLSCQIIVPTPQMITRTKVVYCKSESSRHNAAVTVRSDANR